MATFKQVIEENDNKWGKIVDISIQTLIVLSLISFSLDTVPDLDSEISLILEYFELISVVIFSIEYVLRVLVSSKRLKFMFSFYGLIDLLAILPFYLSTGVDLRSVRAFRLFRLFRAFKLLKYSSALSRFRIAFQSIREEMILFLFLTCILLFLAAVGIYYFENTVQPEKFTSVFDGLWWAVSSLTTVGYGDIYPITVGGKIFTFFVLMIGLGIIAVPTGLLASSLSKSPQ